MSFADGVHRPRAQAVIPVLWTDFNCPDAEGAYCAIVDSMWHQLEVGSRVKLDDHDGMTLTARTIGHVWTGPSGTRYVRAVEERP